MSDPEQGKKKGFFGQPEGKGPTRHTGGIVNYAVTSLWLFLAYAGWAIALGGLSALQHYVNDSGSNGGWAIPANYPLLRAGQTFRLDWFILFLQLVVLTVVVLALLSSVLAQSRAAVVGFLSVSTVLQIISTDRMYNIEHFGISSGHRSAAWAAFVGFLLAATADFALIYHLGLQPEERGF